jgi:hypothetical protein
MREILFRAKLDDDYVDSNQWVYGGGVWTFDNGNTVMFGPDDDGKPCVHSVKSETVGQFTGLLDKHNKKIFEGDVMETWRVENHNMAMNYSYVRGIVYWQDGALGVNGMSFGEHENEHSTYIKDWVVIGNIHDNPELLEDNDAKTSTRSRD